MLVDYRDLNTMNHTEGNAGGESACYCHCLHHMHNRAHAVKTVSKPILIKRTNVYPKLC